METSPIDRWLRAAVDDAERRGLGELKPLLETIARSTAALRDADRSARQDEDEGAPQPGTTPRRTP